MKGETAVWYVRQRWCGSRRELSTSVGLPPFRGPCWACTRVVAPVLFDIPRSATNRLLPLYDWSSNHLCRNTFSPQKAQVYSLHPWTVSWFGLSCCQWSRPCTSLEKHFEMGNPQSSREDNSRDARKIPGTRMTSPKASPSCS